MLAKADIRRLSRERLSILNLDQKSIYSKSVCSQLIKYIESTKVKQIAVYMPTLDEPDIISFIDFCMSRSLPLYMPKCMGETYSFVRFRSYDDLCVGPYSIQEPSLSDDILNSSLVDTLYIVPGLAFSLSGQRIGHGKGIYDRLLKNVDSAKIGVCFPEQVFDDWTIEDHDISVNTLVM